jgi:PXPV repeat (3 copies)
MTMLKIPARAGSFAALAMAAALAASPAASRDRLSPGAAAALGILGGLAVGGAIAAGQGPVYAAPAPVYVEHEPVYVAPPPPVLVEHCFIERSSEYVPGWGWQRVRRRICD